MSETRSPRKRARVSYGSIDGSTLRVKFYVNPGEDNEQPFVDFDTASLPSEMQKLLIPYGVNAAFKAGSGEGETAAEAQKRFGEFCAALRAGEWSPGRGRGEGESGPSELVLAVMRCTSRSREDVEEIVEPLTPAEKRQLRNDQAVANALRDIKIERAREAARNAKGKPSVLGSLFSNERQAAE